MKKIEIYESNGQDGYSEGFWGYVVRDEDGVLGQDGGFAARELAEAAAKSRWGV